MYIYNESIESICSRISRCTVRVNKSSREYIPPSFPLTISYALVVVVVEVKEKARVTTSISQRVSAVMCTTSNNHKAVVKIEEANARITCARVHAVLRKKQNNSDTHSMGEAKLLHHTALLRDNAILTSRVAKFNILARSHIYMYICVYIRERSKGEAARGGFGRTRASNKLREGAASGSLSLCLLATRARLTYINVESLHDVLDESPL